MCVLRFVSFRFVALRDSLHPFSPGTDRFLGFEIPTLGIWLPAGGSACVRACVLGLLAES